MLATIVVATDGSEGADRAVDYAASRTKTGHADLVILNVIGGYRPPDKLMRAFTHAQNAWLREEPRQAPRQIPTCSGLCVSSQNVQLEGCGRSSKTSLFA